MKALYSQFVKPGELAFDIGANIGERTQTLLDIGCRVVAVEPQGNCVTILRDKFRNNSQVEIVAKGLSGTEGWGQLMMAETSTLSSFSLNWIAAVKKSGRFNGHGWAQIVSVQITTLNQLIEEFGVPAFVKIDVEGYESEVLKGLSRAVKAVSFEFTPEYLESALAAAAHCHSLGICEFNYTLGASSDLVLDQWVGYSEIAAKLSQYCGSLNMGDVYARIGK